MDSHRPQERRGGTGDQSAEKRSIEGLIILNKKGKDVRSCEEMLKNAACDEEERREEGRRNEAEERGTVGRRRRTLARRLRRMFRILQPRLIGVTCYSWIKLSLPLARIRISLACHGLLLLCYCYVIAMLLLFYCYFIYCMYDSGSSRFAVSSPRQSSEQESLLS